VRRGSPPIQRSVAVTACAPRYGTTPSHDRNAGAAASKPASRRRSDSVSVSKFTATNTTDEGSAMFASCSRSRFQTCVAG